MAHSLIDDAGIEGLMVIMIGEESSLQQRLSNRCEVFRRDDGCVHLRRSLSLRKQAAFYLDSTVPGPADDPLLAERIVARDRRGFDSHNGIQTAHYVVSYF